MAYMSQEKKKELALQIMACCKKYGVKASLGVDNHSTLVLNIYSSPIDFIGNYNTLGQERLGYGFNPAEKHRNVNQYWYREHYDGTALEFLSELIPLMNNGNHDHSDSQSDFYDVGWYISINIGRYNKPYLLTQSNPAV